jgi:hypothetical protein
MDRLRFNQDHNWTYNYLETPSLAAVFGAIIMKSIWMDNVSWHAAYHLAGLALVYVCWANVSIFFFQHTPHSFVLDSLSSICCLLKLAKMFFALI